MEPFWTPAVIAAASLLARAAFALLSKFKVTVWPLAPATVTVDMAFSPSSRAECRELSSQSAYVRRLAQTQLPIARTTSGNNNVN